MCSADNPADLGSRGIPSAQLVVADIWWQGPTWLRGSPSEWPGLRIGITIPTSKRENLEI